MSGGARPGFTKIPHTLRLWARENLEPVQAWLLVELIGDAQHEPTIVTLLDGSGSVRLDVGEILTSSRGTAEQYELDRDVVRRALDRYEQLGAIKRRPAAPPSAPRSAPLRKGDKPHPPTIVRIEIFRGEIWDGGTTTTATRPTPAAPPTAPRSAPVLDVQDRKTEAKRSPPPPASGAAERVFSHWVKVMEKPASTDFDRKRRRAVARHLKAGKSVEQLCSAVDGCKLDPFSMGRNKIGRPLDDITWIFRDAENVEKFIAIAEKNAAHEVNAAPEVSARRQHEITETLREAEAEYRAADSGAAMLHISAAAKESFKTPGRKWPGEAPDGDHAQARRLHEEIGTRLTTADREQLEAARMLANNGSNNWKPYVRKATEIRDRIAAEEQAPLHAGSAGNPGARSG